MRREETKAHLGAILGGVQVDLEGPVGEGAVLSQIAEFLVGIVRAGLGHIPVTHTRLILGRQISSYLLHTIMKRLQGALNMQSHSDVLSWSRGWEELTCASSRPSSSRFLLGGSRCTPPKGAWSYSGRVQPATTSDVPQADLVLTNSSRSVGTQSIAT